MVDERWFLYILNTKEWERFPVSNTHSFHYTFLIDHFSTMEVHKHLFPTPRQCEWVSIAIEPDILSRNALVCSSPLCFHALATKLKCGVGWGLHKEAAQLCFPFCQSITNAHKRVKPGNSAEPAPSPPPYISSFC